jgi:hypothetical protein
MAHLQLDRTRQLYERALAHKNRYRPGDSIQGNRQRGRGNDADGNRYSQSGVLPLNKAVFRRKSERDDQGEEAHPDRRVTRE